MILSSSLLQKPSLTPLETLQGSLWITPAETHCNSQESSCGSERTTSLHRGNSKGGQIFTPASYKGEGQLPRDAVPASPTQCSPLRGSGQGGCLLQEPKAMSPWHRSQACSSKGITGTPEDPSHASSFLAWEKRWRKGAGALCALTPQLQAAPRAQGRI